MPKIYFFNSPEDAAKVLQSYTFTDESFDAAVEYLKENDADSPILTDALEFSKSRQMLKELNALYAADDAIKEGDNKTAAQIRKFLAKSQDKSVREFAAQLPEERIIAENETPVSSSPVMTENMQEIMQQLDNVDVKTFTGNPDSLAGDLMKKTEFVSNDGKPVSQSTQNEYFDTLVECTKQDTISRLGGNRDYFFQTLEEKRQQLFAIMDQTLSKNIVDMATASQLGDKKKGETDEEYENRGNIAINKVKYQIQKNQKLTIKQSVFARHVADSIRTSRQYLKKLYNRGKNIVAKMFEPRVNKLEEKSFKLFNKPKFERTKKEVTCLNFRRWKKIAKNIVIGAVLALCLGGATYGAYSIFKEAKAQEKAQVKGSNKKSDTNDSKTYKVLPQDFQKARADTMTAATATEKSDGGFYESFPEYNKGDSISLKHHNEIKSKITGQLARRNAAFEKWNETQIAKYGNKATIIPVKDPETKLIEGLNNIHAANLAHPEYFTVTQANGKQVHLTDMQVLYLYMKNVEFSEKTVNGPKIGRDQYLISNLDAKGNPQFASMPEAMTSFDDLVNCGYKIKVPVKDFQSLLSRIDLKTGKGLTADFKINQTNNVAVGIMGRDCPDGVPAHTGTNLWKKVMSKVKKFFVPETPKPTPAPEVTPDTPHQGTPHIEDVKKPDLSYVGNAHVTTNRTGSKSSAGAIGEYNGEGKGNGDFLNNMKGTPVQRSEIPGTEVIVKNVKNAKSNSGY